MPAARAARLLFQLPRTSRVYIKIDPTNQWGWSEVLANRTNYLLDLLAWQNTKDATKKPPQNIPKLYVPSFMESVVAAPTGINKDAVVMETEDIQYILDRPRKATPPPPK